MNKNLNPILGPERKRRHSLIILLDHLLMLKLLGPGLLTHDRKLPELRDKFSNASTVKLSTKI